MALENIHATGSESITILHIAWCCKRFSLTIMLRMHLQSVAGLVMQVCHL